MSLTFFVLQHAATGELMPESKGRGGYTNWVPGDPNSFDNSLITPRLFVNEDSARRALVQWAMGTRDRKRHVDTGEYGMIYGEWDEIVILDAGRKKTDLVVRPAQLVLG